MTNENSTSFGYLFFHLNLAFSAVEEEQRLTVIEKCYYPILDIVRDLKIPVGIELTGYTLEVIETLKPEWIEDCKIS